MPSFVSQKPNHAAAAMDAGRLPPLENGDHLDQPTFHARYAVMPADTRAELIGGIVYLMSSPLKRRHGKMHLKLGQWLSTYQDATPGTEAFDSTTAILDDQSEPQADLSLLISPSHGGPSRITEEDFILGAAEFMTEIASSTESIDLHAKKKDYERAGVLEYLVVAVRKRRVYWFRRVRRRFQEMAPDEDGILRSQVFPGLWLDPDALLGEDFHRVMEVLQQGLASPEHAAFVARLARSGPGTA
jgi:Uma2 family endonuclease